ncbi:unnamed protein product, partial [Coregonus sp. 'balchen']
VLSLPHRRLVCYCRLFEVPDPNKLQKLGLHQREIFLFNDLLVVDYGNGIRLTSAIPGADIKVLINFNAPNPQDRKKFTDDLRESIAEVQEMEKYRIESELEKQKGVVRPSMSQSSGLKKEAGNGNMNRASLDDTYTMGEGLKRSALSSSLRDLSEAGKRGRRSSAGSLDSNMEGSIISSPHICRRATTPRIEGPSRGHPTIPNSSSLLGSLFGSKRGKPSSQSHPPLPLPGHPTLISHTPHPSNLHHTAQQVSQAQLHHSQYCHVQQNPPPYHHHHHYHPPPHTQYHQHPAAYASSSHTHQHTHPHAHVPQHSHGAHSQHSHHASHSQHAPHHHSQQQGPAPWRAQTQTQWHQLPWMLFGSGLAILLLLATSSAQPSPKPADTTELHPQNNQLSTVYPGHFDSLQDLRRVTLSRNLFHCDCGIQFLRIWLRRNRAVVSGGVPTCASPSSVAHTAITELSDAYFSCAQRSCAGGAYDILVGVMLCGLISLLLWGQRLAKKATFTPEIDQRHAGLEADSLRSLKPKHRRLQRTLSEESENSASLTWTDDPERPLINMEILPQILDVLHKKRNIKMKAT